MAFPTTGVLDSFTRADEGPPPSANWTNNPTNTANGGLKVVSNTCAGETAGDNQFNEGYWNSAFSADQEAYFTITTIPAVNRSAALLLRIASPATASADCYYAQLVKAAGTDTVQIWRIDNAAFTQLGATISQEIGAEGFGFEAIGSTLTVYYNPGSWTSFASRTDATYSGGYIGVMIEDIGARVDNFGGGTVVVSAAGWGMLLSDSRDRLVTR